MKTVLITGAASGIGLECAKQIATLGHNVISFDLKACPLSEVKSYTVDVRKSEQIKKAVAELGDVDVLVSSAGVYNQAPISEVLNSDVNALVDVNLKGNLLVCQAVLPLLRKAKGNIVIVSSGIGVNVDPLSPVYCATKAGLNMLIKCLANTEPQNGVRVNGVLPGPIDTPLLNEWFNSEEEKQSYANCVPLKKVGSVYNVAQAVLFLTGLGGLDASYVNGALLSVDGGESVSSALINTSKPNKN